MPTSSAPAPTHPAKKHYLKLVEWSEEDGCYLGRCPELFLGGVHGDDEAQVYQDLCAAAAAVLALKAQHGDPLPPSLAGKRFSGKFILRTSPELHRTLAIRALQAGDSLNNFVVKRLMVEG
jgi:predicted RNase H-like HicB family nuclease